jgi:SRSO17 transposase
VLVFDWVTGDEAYGDNTRPRRRCQSRGLNYVFAVSCDHPLRPAGTKTPADHAFATLDADTWQRYSCGDGAKGKRSMTGRGESEWMLARRSTSDPADLAFYRCHAARPVGLPKLVRVAGFRWSVEEVFQTSKNEVSLDHHQIRMHTA